MRRLFFLVFLSLMLAGCSSGADRKSENRRDQTETAAEEEEREGAVQEVISSEDDMTAEEIMSFLESFEPGLSFADMDAEETEGYGDALEDAYELMGRKTEDGFGYVLAVLKKEKQSPLDGLAVYEEGNDLAAGKGSEPSFLFTRVNSLMQGNGNQVLYLQPKDLAAPEEMQQVFRYRFCEGEEGRRYLEDAKERGVRFSPPDHGAYLCVERYENGKNYTEYVELTAEEEQEILRSDEAVYPPLYGNYGIQFFVSEDTYETEEIEEGSITMPALRIAEEQCRFQAVELSEVHDIVKAEMKMRFQEYDESTGTISREWEETETLTERSSLQKLEEMIASSKPAFESGSPYTGILTLTREDGTEITVPAAADGSSSFILGSYSVYEPESGSMEELWELFPMMRENTGWSEALVPGR